jgi:hypothetical protein
MQYSHCVLSVLQHCFLGGFWVFILLFNPINVQPSNILLLDSTGLSPVQSLGRHPASFGKLIRTSGVGIT